LPIQHRALSAGLTLQFVKVQFQSCWRPMGCLLRGIHGPLICAFSAQGNFSINSIGWKARRPGVWETGPGRKGPPLCPSSGLSFHQEDQDTRLRSPAPLTNPRWHLLGATVAYALVASCPPSSPRPTCSEGRNGACCDFIAKQFRKASLPVFISETFKVCRAYFISSWSSCSVGLEDNEE
jgi:hypothetical protein